MCDTCKMYSKYILIKINTNFLHISYSSDMRKGEAKDNIIHIHVLVKLEPKETS